MNGDLVCGKVQEILDKKETSDAEKVSLIRQALLEWDEYAS